MTTAQVSELLGVSVRTITGWAEAYQQSGGSEGIPGFKIGRSWRFERLKIEDWLQEKGCSDGTLKAVSR